MKGSRFWLLLLVLGLFLLPFTSASTNNVKFRYSFDSDFTDSAGNNDLTPFCVGGCPTISTKFVIGNGSANFTGVDSRGLIGGFYSLPNDLSVAAWVNYTNAGPIFTYTNRTVNNHVIFHILSNGSLALRTENNSGAQIQIWVPENAPVLTTNKFYHVGFSIDGNGGTRPKFYINGTEYTSTNSTGPASGIDAWPGGIGLQTQVGWAFTSGSTDAMGGNIDELAVWEKIISATDFSSLYANGAGLEFPYSLASDANFSVLYNSTENLAVTTKVTTQENSSDFNYKYSLSCDISQTVLWNEVFNSFYNFTLQNVSTSFTTPESYLTFQGIEWENTVGVTENFDVFKNSNQAYRDYLLLNVQYQTSANHYAELLAYDSGDNPGLYLILNKTGSTLIVSQYFPEFSSNINIANFTLSGGNVNLGIQFVPHHNGGMNTDDFTFTIKESNHTGTQTASFYETSTSMPDVKNVEMFVGNRFNGTTFYKRLGLTKTGNPFPEFVEFQNGQRDVIDGITFEVPAPSEEIDGDGFTLIPDFNNVFYSVCQYDSPGQKTQRHFIGLTGEVDNWDNYRDIIITAAQVSSNTSESTEGGNAGPGTGDAATDVIPAFFAGLGFKSVASKLFIWAIFWLAICIVIAYFGAPLLAALLFVAMMLIGVPMGMVPLWFFLVFVIVAAGIMAAFYRAVFAG